MSDFLYSSMEGFVSQVKYPVGIKFGQAFVKTMIYRCQIQSLCVRIKKSFVKDAVTESKDIKEEGRRKNKESFDCKCFFPLCVCASNENAGIFA